MTSAAQISYCCRVVADRIRLSERGKTSEYTTSYGRRISAPASIYCPGDIQKEIDPTHMRLIVSAVATLALTNFALAKAPADIADLVGARAPGAESEMQSRGYVDIKNNTWWNEGTKTCVRVHVSQGKYSTITQVKSSACGQGSAAVECPSDLSQADLYKHPGCSL